MIDTAAMVDLIARIEAWLDTNEEGFRRYRRSHPGPLPIDGREYHRRRKARR